MASSAKAAMRAHAADFLQLGERHAESNRILGGGGSARNDCSSRNSGDPSILHPIASFAVAPKNRPDGIVRCSPRGSGYSPDQQPCFR
jgi:hypothetical protein